MSEKFSISIKNIRAVESAKIELNGITVLAGENGCGKTTISKLLYTLIKTSLNFDRILKNAVYQKLPVLVSIVDEVYFLGNSSDSPTMDSAFRFNLRNRIIHNENATNDLIEEIFQKIHVIRERYSTNELNISKVKFQRLKSLYETRILGNSKSMENIIDLMDDIELYINELSEKEIKIKNEQNLKVYETQLQKCFNEDVKDWTYNLKEYSEKLIDKVNKFVTEQKSFTNVIYIDVPTIFDELNVQLRANDSLLSDLYDNLLNTNNLNEENDQIRSAIDGILNGEIYQDKNLFSRIFMYKAKNGKEILLSQAASGIKCFAVLERLYSNGLLTENTLLIIDEPEVHLHPKWIVEYARVIVLIQKYLHTTILLASHSTDMISAIKYISSKEGCSDKLTFYMAELSTDDDFGKYVFENQGIDIEKIFNSFNGSLDKINLYGEFDDE